MSENMLAPDKKKHTWFMMTGTLLVSLITDNVWLAGTLALIIGLAKEMYDHFYGTTGFNVDDMVANSIGIFAAMLLYIGTKEMLKIKKEE